MQTEDRERIRDLPLTGARMPLELRNWLIAEARRRHRSLSGQLIAIIEAERRRQQTEGEWSG